MAWIRDLGRIALFAGPLYRKLTYKEYEMLREQQRSHALWLRGQQSTDVGKVIVRKKVKR